MKQVLQYLNTGSTVVEVLSPPSVLRGHLLIQTKRSLISSGTERTIVQFSKTSLIEKVRQQPDKVVQILDKVRTDGLLSVIDSVRSKLDTPLPLGYCNAGRVLAIGDGVKGFHVGDRVASNGRHAEVVSVPANLCAKVPDEVSDEDASFTILASIGLQGIRLAKPSLGENFVIIGAGLIGLLTIQILRAHGCRVLAFDPDKQKLKLARQFGAEICASGSGPDLIRAGMEFSYGNGVDGVIITAATKSSAPIALAAKMSRKRGRIILVGVTGLELNRADFYEKELSFQVSCSYGPGRYDTNYEERGCDYPLGYVRWTEQRNFEAVLQLLASGQLQTSPLVSHRFPLDKAPEAYSLLSSKDSTLGIILEYPQAASKAVLPKSSPKTSLTRKPARVVIGMIGAGNYADRVLIPYFKNAGVELHTVVSGSGLSARLAEKKYSFKYSGSDSDLILKNPEINTVVIATRHNLHAQLVVDCLKAEKNIFCEKPLCLSQKELEKIFKTYQYYCDSNKSKHLSKQSNSKYQGGPILTVGFNRRFSPLIIRTQNLLKTKSGPKSYIMTVNAGSLPANHWTLDQEVGGGRIIGEGCHFIDLIRALVGHPITLMKKVNLGSTEDTATILLKFLDGSLGTILYFENGNRAFPKERLEIFSGNEILQLDNFKKLTGYGWRGFKSERYWNQDKGQKMLINKFVSAVESGGPEPIPIDEIFEVTAASIQLQKMISD